jgi:hypothetical protein
MFARVPTALPQLEDPKHHASYDRCHTRDRTDDRPGQGRIHATTLRNNSYHR